MTLQEKVLSLEMLIHHSESDETSFLRCALGASHGTLRNEISVSGLLRNKQGVLRSSWIASTATCTVLVQPVGHDVGVQHKAPHTAVGRRNPLLGAGGFPRGSGSPSCSCPGALTGAPGGFTGIRKGFCSLAAAASLSALRVLSELCSH